MKSRASMPVTQLIREIIERKSPKKFYSFDESCYHNYEEILKRYEENAAQDTDGEMLKTLMNYWPDYLAKHWEMSGMAKMTSSNFFADENRCKKLISYYGELSNTQFFAKTSNQLGMSKYYFYLAETFKTLASIQIKAKKIDNIKKAILYYEHAIQSNPMIGDDNESNPIKIENQSISRTIKSLKEELTKYKANFHSSSGMMLFPGEDSVNLNDAKPDQNKTLTL